MNAQEIVRSLGIVPKHWGLTQQYLNCPFCKGRSKTTLSFIVRDDGHALWMCHRCPERGCTTQAAYKSESREGGFRQRSARPEQPAPSVGVEPDRSRPAPQKVPYSSSHAAFWDSCEPITARSPAGRYLATRSCPLPPPEADLRWHPDIEHWREPHKGPCMIGRITDAINAAPMSFHFTWIAADGSAKARLDKPRLLAPGMAKMGGVIRLCDEAELGTNGNLLWGEGIETVLSSMVPCRTPQAWSTIDSGNMASLPIPEWCEVLIVLADHDRVNKRTGKRPGIEAGMALGERVHALDQNINFRLWIPPLEGDDWNDVFRRHRVVAKKVARLEALRVA